jgi:hypothetical protein
MCNLKLFCRFNVPDVAEAAGFAIEWASPEFTKYSGGDVFGVHQLPGAYTVSHAC